MQANVFTWEYETKVNVLITDIQVAAPFDEASPPESPPSETFQAIWDTGTVNTAISSRIVQTYKLQSTGTTDVITVIGKARKPTYAVSLWLPNKIHIAKIPVAETEIMGADVLIGMDIISLGDFAVTYRHGKTVLSFRIPSIECIDFTEPTSVTTGNGKVLNKIPIGIEQAIPKVGRNDLCPCGSGLKYKRCHGK
jgi:hypothetical protein